MSADKPKSDPPTATRSTVAAKRSGILRQAGLLKTFLEVQHSDGSSETIDLGDSELYIGRDPECGLTLEDDMVSWHHAKIYKSGEEYVLEDLESTNGTLLNGVQIFRSFLRHMDTVELGGCHIVYIEKMVRSTEAK